jgi:hypothetical protein
MYNLDRLYDRMTIEAGGHCHRHRLFAAANRQRCGLARPSPATTDEVAARPAEAFVVQRSLGG